MKHRKLIALAGAAIIALSTPLIIGDPVASAAAARVPTVAVPAVACSGNPQRCDDLLQNQAETSLFLGNSHGVAIVFTSDGSQTQRWDIYQMSNGNYVIYNNGTNNVLTRGTSCTSNGGTYMYCAVVEPQGSPVPQDQQWVEIHTAPLIFQSVGSGSRCLDNPGANAPAGSQVVLYPCNTSDTAEQWFAKSSA